MNKNVTIEIAKGVFFTGSAKTAREQGLQDYRKVEADRVRKMLAQRANSNS